MSIRDNQLAELHLAVVYQNSINQLDAIDQKYSSYIDLLSPVEKGRREQIEANLFPHLNNLETQKRFVWLCEFFAFEKYLEQKYLDLLATVRAEEIEEFLAEQEKTLLKAAQEKESEWARIAELDKKEMLKRIQELLDRIDKIIADLKKQNEQLHLEIKKLEERKEFLIERIENNVAELDEVMVGIYRDFSESKEVKEIAFGDYKHISSDKEIAKRLLDRFEGKIEAGIIPVERIEEVEREVISDMIHQAVPQQYLDMAGRAEVERQIDQRHEYLRTVVMQNPDFVVAQKKVENIIADKREIEVIEVEIIAKKELVEVNGVEINTYQEMKSDVKDSHNAEKLSIEKIAIIEGRLDREDRMLDEDADFGDEFGSNPDGEDKPDLPPPSDDPPEPDAPGGPGSNPSPPPSVEKHNASIIRERIMHSAPPAQDVSRSAYPPPYNPAYESKSPRPPGGPNTSEIFKSLADSMKISAIKIEPSAPAIDAKENPLENKQASAHKFPFLTEKNAHMRANKSDAIAKDHKDEKAEVNNEDSPRFKK